MNGRQTCAWGLNENLAHWLLQKAALRGFAGVTESRRVDSAKNGVDESGGFERREVVGSLPKSDQLDRHAELLLDPENEHNRALRRPRPSRRFKANYDGPDFVRRGARTNR